MTAQTFVLPYLRNSPVHIPRRDLVLAASDDLTLRVVIMASDNPTASPLALTGGLGGPALRMVIWRDRPGGSWDYDAPRTVPGDTIWSGAGVIASDQDGAFDIQVPAATMSSWPIRCGFLLAFDQNLSSDVLALGRLHVMPAVGGPESTAEAITTDALAPITTD
jgi:hypothetical protein